MDYINKQFNIIAVIFALLFSFFLTYHIHNNGAWVSGEFLSTYLPIYSLSKHGVPYITEETFEQSRKYYEDLYSMTGKDSFQKISQHNWQSFNKDTLKSFPLYFPTFSFLAAPVFFAKEIVIGKGYINIPAYTNIILLFISSLLLIFRFKIKNSKKIILLLFIILSPYLIYFKWSAHDYSIIILFTISLIFFFNNEYKKSFFIGAMTANMNPVLYMLLFGMLLVYLYRLYDKNKSIKINILDNFKELFLSAMAFIIPIILNIWFVYSAIGRIGMSTVTSNYKGDLPFARSLAYLFDLNFGVLPYYPLLLIIFVAIFIPSIYKKKIEPISLIVFFFISIIIYGTVHHINCGMQGIHRYMAYLAPFMIFVIIFYYEDVFNKRYVKYIKNGILFSVFISSIYSVTIFSEFYKSDNIYMQPVAKFVLNNAPSLYNPLYSTFNSRVNHIDGGYIIEKPIVYIDDKKNEIRKLLLKKEFITENFFTCFQGDDRSISYLMSKIERIKDDRFHYINIPDNIHLSYNADILNIVEELPLGYIIKTNESDKLVGYNNFSHDEQTHRWSLGSSSSIFFKADESLESSKYIHINFSTYANQNIKIYLNGENIFNGYNLSLGGNEIVIPINNKLINVGKINEIKFEHPYARKPDNGDNRIIAIMFHSLAFLEE